MRTALAIFAVMALVLSYCWQGAAARTEVGGEVKDSGGVLDGVDVNALCLMSLGEAIDTLGPDYESGYSVLGEYIGYGDACTISYFTGGYRVDENGEFDPHVDMGEDIESIMIQEEADVYKGISVGKTLDEMNSNPDLLNKLKLSYNASDNMTYASGYYVYEKNILYMEVYFDEEDMVCFRIIVSTSFDMPLI